MNIFGRRFMAALFLVYSSSIFFLARTNFFILLMKQDLLQSRKGKEKSLGQKPRRGDHARQPMGGWSKLQRAPARRMSRWGTLLSPRASRRTPSARDPSREGARRLGLGAWTNFSLRFPSGSLSLCATASLLLPSPKPRIGFGRGRANAHARDH